MNTPGALAPEVRPRNVYMNSLYMYVYELGTMTTAEEQHESFSGNTTSI